MVRIVHQIWLSWGDKPMPGELLERVAQWRDLCNNHGWEHRLTLGKVDIAKDEAQAARRVWGDHVQGLKALSDLERYRLLYDVGGLYVDMDIEPIGNPLRCVHDTLPTFFSPRGVRFPCNGVLWAPRPGEDLFDAIHAVARQKLLHQEVHQVPTAVTGPRVVRAVLQSWPGQWWDVGHPLIAFSEWRAAPRPTSETRLVIHNRWKGRVAA
jgi:mannosyltransferase OCH1-like enzyme